MTSGQKYTSCSEADGRARRSVCLCDSYLPLAQNSPAKSDRFWGWHILIPFRTPRDGEAKSLLSSTVFFLLCQTYYASLDLPTLPLAMSPWCP